MIDLSSWKTTKTEIQNPYSPTTFRYFRYTLTGEAMAFRRSARLLKQTHNTDPQSSDSLAEAVTFTTHGVLPALTLEQLVARLDFLDFYSRETIAGTRENGEPMAKRAGLNHYPLQYSLGERMGVVCPLLDQGPGRFWCRPRYGIYLLDYS